MKRFLRAGMLATVLLFGIAGNYGAVQASETWVIQIETSQTETDQTTSQDKTGQTETDQTISQDNAGQTETDQTETETVTVQPPTAKKAGWLSSGGYRYYFRTAKKMVTGWRKISGKIYYFRTAAEGTAPQGSMVTGFYTVGDRTFYFSKTGKLQTGWKKLGGKYYYFQTKGILGRIGTLQKNRWIDHKKYYVDENGQRLTSCVTPDGYIVNESGVKVKAAKGWVKLNGNYYYYVSRKMETGWKQINGKMYYFNENGVRQKGWLTLDGDTYYLKKGVMQTGWRVIGGKKYYFDSDGKLQKNTTIDGIAIDADGIAEAKISVLLISGHGMGDPGATSTIGTKSYYEEKYTRQFASLIQTYLKEAAGDNIAVTMYDQNYDCYQVNYAYQKNKKVIGPLPDWNAYDYILEVHFNATVESAKDLTGDGTMKGVGIYVFPSKTQVAIEKKIVSAIASTGIPIWGRGTGVFSRELLNARTCYEAGVSYSLLETAFIDDKDDMKFYNKNKKAMAKAAANAIAEYFS